MKITALTLSQKIGQLLMVGFDGLEPDAQIESLLDQLQVGGVILFRRNVSDPAQVASLTRSLQQRNALSSALPLMIAIDQEGGMVARLEQGLTPLPSAQALAATGELAAVRELTCIANRELKQMGINVNFAPVLDVNNNPRNPVIGVRAFGDSVETVSRYGLAALRAVNEAGVVPVIKHFPGHGDTEVDSHLGLPSVPHGRERLDAVELAPFRAALAAGAPAVMSAHVVFPAIEADRDTPSTCSAAVLNGLLRRELGFDGVIFTDCLEMDAIAAGMGVVQGALAAFRAGADILLVSHRLDRQRAVHAALLEAVLSGEISEARVDQSLARILRLKEAYRMAQWSLPEAVVPDILASADSLALSARLHAAALHWEGGVARLDPQFAALVVQCEVRQRTEMDETETRDGSLAAQLREAGMPVRAVYLPLVPEQEDIETVLRLSDDFAQVIVVSYNAMLHPRQRQLLNELSRRAAARTWLVAGRIAGDLAEWPMLRGRLTCYANRPAALRAVAAGLLGWNAA
ncbi:beta-N-acetylhexosaminidase [Chitinilyticum piscinae]|uniref:Beta-N-acetylhexosaminidase n=1 Tax=Chitinilyticum piscinae TaxID=2866724 RepID=A0A8J7G1F5_9NEIS|nr:beta-N-acetylhexosaminidase [Chitinilyticum piscinae]MBE9610220.1 beta-N-acetylhexosaminidase [Chitinilyticum piscinae]